MSQDYTDNCFQVDHIVETDMQNIENNFAALSSLFSGSSAPSNTKAGKPWFDIDTDQLYIRNKDDDQWLTLGFIPGTIMLFGQASAPLGWTKLTSWTDNSMICINTQANGTALGSGGTANPQSQHTHTGPSHTHTGPSHTHSLTFTPQNFLVGGGTYGLRYDIATVASGTGNTGASGTDPTGNNTAPLYQEIMACTKD
jgi:hypothetical protein